LIANCLNTQQRGVGDPTAETFIGAGTLGATDLTGNGNEADFLIAAFDERQITSGANRSTVERGGPCPTLNGGAGMSVVGFTNRGLTTDDNAHETLHAASHGAIPMAQSGMSVRRLTPVECERLMGWPDDHTRYRPDGSEIPDGARYRLCGNGVVAPVAFWIAQRMRAALEAT
jgi:site-specific DNA-cytosine methylase